MMIRRPKPKELRDACMKTLEMWGIMVAKVEGLEEQEELPPAIKPAKHEALIAMGYAEEDFPRAHCFLCATEGFLCYPVPVVHKTLCPLGQNGLDREEACLEYHRAAAALYTGDREAYLVACRALIARVKDWLEAHR